MGGGESSGSKPGGSKNGSAGVGGGESSGSKPGGSKNGSAGVGGGESSMKLEWPTSSLPQYTPNNLQNSPKMVVLLELIFRSVKVGEKVLVFR